MAASVAGRCDSLNQPRSKSDSPWRAVRLCLLSVQMSLPDCIVITSSVIHAYQEEGSSLSNEDNRFMRSRIKAKGGRSQVRYHSTSRIHW